MLSSQNKNNLLALILATVLEIGLAIYWLFSDRSTVFLILLSLLVILISILLLFLLTLKRNQKLMEYLNNCELRTYLFFYEKDLAKQKHPHRRAAQDATNILALNLFVGYYHLGDFTRAKAMLDLVLFQKTKGMSRQLSLHAYLINSCSYYTTMKLFDKAELFLQAAKEQLTDPAYPKYAKEAGENNYRMMRLELQMAKGDYEGAVPALLSYWATKSQTGTLLDRVTLQYELAIAYYHTGNTEQAIPYFRAVIATGKETRYVRQSMGYLEELGVPYTE